MSFSITSSAFNAGQEIPDKYTCNDKDISPPLQWSGIPQGTQSLGLIVDHPDAPDPTVPKMTWVHWVLYNLPPNSSGLPEAVQYNELFSSTLEGINSWDRAGYGGPRPPIGRHRYIFKLYARERPPRFRFS